MAARMLTLTYYGAAKVDPHYNVMGVAKAALETTVLLSRGRSRREEHPRQRHLRRADQDAGRLRHRRLPLYLKWNEYNSPLRRNVTTTKSAKPAVYLLSDMSRGVTGENLHVDSGYHIVGMKHPDAPDIGVNSREP